MAELTEAQKGDAVNKITVKLARAESNIEKAIVAIAELPAAIKEFHEAIGTHVTYSDIVMAYESVAAAGRRGSQALQELAFAHSRLNELRKAKELPEPDLVTLNGGGGGKP